MRDWIRSLEKAELHVHLEGSIDVETLCAIDPSLSRQDALEGYEYRDFQGFLKSFAFAAKRLQSPEDYSLAARRLFEKLAAQGVVHAEVILGRDKISCPFGMHSCANPHVLLWPCDGTSMPCASGVSIKLGMSFVSQWNVFTKVR